MVNYCLKKVNKPMRGRYDLIVNEEHIKSVYNALVKYLSQTNGKGDTVYLKYFIFTSGDNMNKRKKELQIWMR